MSGPCPFQRALSIRRCRLRRAGAVKPFSVKESGALLYSWRLPPSICTPSRSRPPLRNGVSIAMPIYREGDILVCTTTIPVRRGDRVILKMKTGEILAGTLGRKTIAGIDLQPFGTSAASETLIAANDKNWIARILWASQ